MSAKSVPQIQKSATPVTAVRTNAELGSVRPFIDDNANLEQESSNTESKVASAASTPPEKPVNRTANSNYNFSRISVADYVPATVQTKLVVGAPGDKYEQEADTMADKVMSWHSSVQKQEELSPEKPEIQAQSVAEPLQSKTEEKELFTLKL